MEVWVGVIGAGNRRYFVPIEPRRLQVFGINPDLAERLLEMSHRSREIEEAEERPLRWFDKAEAMFYAFQAGQEYIPFNQCARWQFMLSTLAELDYLKLQFGEL